MTNFSGIFGTEIMEPGIGLLFEAIFSTSYFDTNFDTLVYYDCKPLFYMGFVAGFLGISALDEHAARIVSFKTEIGHCLEPSFSDLQDDF